MVVDDCSTDETIEILRDVEKKHPNVRVFRNEINGGVAATRNRIIREALGEFIAFFDDDDKSVPERISNQHARITEYEREFASGASVVCHSARLQYYPDGENRYESTMGTRHGRIAPHGDAVAKRVLTGRPTRDGLGSLRRALRALWNPPRL